MMIGGVDFSSLSVALGTDAKTGEPVLLEYGEFIQALIDFLIIAAAIFMALKAINSMKRPAGSSPRPRRRRPSGAADRDPRPAAAALNQRCKRRAPLRPPPRMPRA